MATNATVCIVESRDSVLMKTQTMRHGKGYWVFPGGKIEPGETPLKCAIRETWEETGLRVKNLRGIGVFKFYVEGKGLNFVVHMFYTNSFSGKPKSTEEGKVKWININKIPFQQMWDGDKYWVPLVLQGNRFDANFYYDRSNKKTLKYEIILRC